MPTDTVTTKTHAISDELKGIVKTVNQRVQTPSQMQENSLKNLKLITSSERARELQRRSVEARRKKKQEYIESTKTISSNARRILKEIDEETGLRNAELVARAMINEAKNGNVAMINLLMAVNKEQPSPNTQLLLTAKLEDFIGGNSKLNEEIDDSCLDVVSVKDEVGVCDPTGEVTETERMVDDTNFDFADESGGEE